MRTSVLVSLVFVALALASMASVAFSMESDVREIVLVPMETPVIEYVMNIRRAEEFIERREDSGCPGSRPSAAHVCIEGVWTYFNTTVARGGIIEAAVGETEFDGSLYMAPGSVLALDGLSSTLWVKGCARLESTIKVTLSKDSVSRMRQDQKEGRKLSYDFMESQCNNVSKAIVEAIAENEECRVWTVSLESRYLLGGRYMTSLNFSSSSLRCNYWWIILISIVLITPAVILIMWAIYRLCCKRFEKRARRPTVRMSE